VHRLDHRSDGLYALREGEGEIMELEKIVIEGISVPFLELRFLGLDVPGFHGGLAHIRLLVHAVGSEVWEIMHHMGLIVLFEGILAFEIESQFLEGPDEDLVEFILFSGAVCTSAGPTGIISPCCPFLEIEDRRRKTGNDRPDMKHGREIEILEREPEKHLRHLCLHEARRSEFVGDLQVLVEDILDGRGLPSGEDILGVIGHAHEDAEEIFSRTRECVASSAHPSA